MSCSNPGQNLATTILEQFISKHLKSREFITENKMVHESRLIQFFTHESRLNKKKITSREHEKILLSVITIHE